MRRFFHVLLFLWLCSFLAWAQGDANPAAQTSAETHAKAKVYIYRYKQFVGSALAPSVFCDGAELARMENGRYFAANLDPGNHTFTSNDKQSGIDLDAKAGQEYFIRVELATGFAKGHGHLILVPREQAAYELSSNKLKPLDPNKIANKEIISLDEPRLQTVSQDSTK